MTGSNVDGGQRVWAALLVTGSVIGLVANALHPHVAGGDTAASFSSIASNDMWVGIHLAIVVAILLVVGGLAGLGMGFGEELGRPMARLGVAATLVGGALITVSTTIDGLTMPSLAQQVVSSESPDVLQIAVAVKSIGFGIWSIGMLVFFGAAFACFGVAVLTTTTYPARYGWIALVGAAGSAVAALLQIGMGEMQEAESIFLVSSVLLTVWSLALGVRLWRTAGVASPGQTTASLPAPLAHG